MGMALRPRVAAGWWSLKDSCWFWRLGGIKAGELELREKPGAMVWGCGVGEDSGELLARDERSEALEMETSCGGDQSEWLEKMTGSSGTLTSLSVSKPGQNSRSSSRSKDRTDSNLLRKAESDADSLSSFMLRTPRNCLCEFCETESLGALRLRPPWWLWETDAVCAGCAP